MELEQYPEGMCGAFTISGVAESTVQVNFLANIFDAIRAY